MDALVEVEDLTGQIEQIDDAPVFAGPYSRVYRGVLNGECIAIKVLQPLGGKALHALRRKIQREKTVWLCWITRTSYRCTVTLKRTSDFNRWVH
ncbi:hypothetical protein FRC15_005463 [Serendipita sp. 397]|nr:hypothetical protein FRC15_005463 [Serendipita sp. 397]